MSNNDKNIELKETKSIKNSTMPEKIENNPELLMVNTEKEPTLPTKIVNTIQDKLMLFTDSKNIAYAKFKVQDHEEVWPISSKRFSRWLIKVGRAVNNNNIPGVESINIAQRYLEAIAFDNAKIELGNRVMKLKNDFWYDLSNEKWQAVQINSDGWRVVDNPPALFKREAHQKPQVKPSKNGNIWKFFDFMKVHEEKELLTLVYMVSCFIPDIPHLILIIYGPQGSGKSMSMEFIRNIIDPSQTPRLKVPNNEKEIVQTFDHHYASFFDNLGIIPPWLSDIICRAVTGEGTEQRMLFTDDEAFIRSYKRCVTLNGINIAATKGDLLDRSILMKLEPFEKCERIEEKMLKERFNEALPEILGGIFDVLVEAIQIYPTVKLGNLPRMADFAKWGYAIAEALGGYGDKFIKSYLEDEEERIHETAEANPLATALIALMKNHKEWEGKPTELLGQLEIVAEEKKIPTNSKLWPNSPVWVSRRLNELEPTLKDLGIIYHTFRDGSERYINLKIRKNTVNTVIPSQVTQYSSGNGKKVLKSSNDMTVNMAVNENTGDSKNLVKPANDQMDSNDSNDSKIPSSDNNLIEKSDEIKNKLNSDDLDLLDMVLMGIIRDNDVKNYEDIVNFVKNEFSHVSEELIKDSFQWLIDHEFIKLNSSGNGQYAIADIDLVEKIMNELPKPRYEDLDQLDLYLIDELRNKKVKASYDEVVDLLKSKYQDMDEKEIKYSFQWLIVHKFLKLNNEKGSHYVTVNKDLCGDLHEF